MDADFFFYCGKADQIAEIEADILAGLTQDTRSMPYDRSYGAGVTEYENLPTGSVFAELLKYKIAAWMAERNSQVSDGSNGTRDMRALTSQTVIEIVQRDGAVSITVPYIPMFDAERAGQVVVSL